METAHNVSLSLIEKLKQRAIDTSEEPYQKVVNKFGVKATTSVNTLQYIDTNHREYAKINGEVKLLLEELHNLKETVNEVNLGLRALSIGSGGGGMDNLEKRVESLEKKVEAIDGRLSNVEKDIALVKERTKKLEGMPTTTEMQYIITQAISEALKPIPTEDKVKTLIRDINKLDKVASEDFVEKKINHAKWQLVVWIVGTGLAVALAILRFLP